MMFEEEQFGRASNKKVCLKLAQLFLVIHFQYLEYIFDVFVELYIFFHSHLKWTRTVTTLHLYQNSNVNTEIDDMGPRCTKLTIGGNFAINGNYHGNLDFDWLLSPVTVVVTIDGKVNINDKFCATGPWNDVWGFGSADEPQIGRSRRR